MSVNLTGNQSSPKDNIIRGYDQPLSGSLSDVNINGSSGGGSAPTETRGLDPLSVLGDVFSATMNYIGVKDTNKTNRELAEKQNEWNLEQWAREIDYNRPINQLKRYEEAGLNPLLAMADMEPGQAPSIQSAPLANQVPFTGWPNIGESLRNAMQLQLAKKQLDINQYDAETNRMNAEADKSLKSKTEKLIEEQTKTQEEQRNNLRASTSNLDSQTKLNITKNNLDEFDLKMKNLYGEDDYVSQIQLRMSQVGVNDETAKKIIEEIKYIPTYAKAAQTQAMAAMKNAEANERNSYTQKDLAESTIKVNNQSITESGYRIDEICSRYKLNRAQTTAIRNANSTFLLDKAIQVIGDVQDIFYKPIKVAGEFLK